MTAWQKIRLIVMYLLLMAALSVCPECRESAELIAALKRVRLPGGRNR